jgi:hypothetical protein
MYDGIAEVQPVFALFLDYTAQKMFTYAGQNDGYPTIRPHSFLAISHLLSCTE